MFRPEHEAALRHQIRSIDRLQLSELDAFGAEFNQVVKEQARLLEEIRIEIHNQIFASKKDEIRIRNLADGVLA